MMIEKEGIRAILASKKIMALPDGASDESELAIDSLTLIKLEVALEDRYGVEINPQPEDLESFTSVTGIYTYLVRQLQLQ